MDIPFYKTYLTGKEFDYIRNLQSFSGEGAYTKKCRALLEKNTRCKKAFLTHSCTAALEMSALLIDTKPGDEIIMPSYTFVSTANAFVLRGGIPIFIDIREDTLNIDEKLIEDAITEKTKAIVPIHYAGVSAEMDTILSIAEKYQCFVIEDAAQCIMARYKQKNLGTLGHLGTYSFHQTKNIISGEGGALLVNDERFFKKAEMICEKGTDRTQLLRGEIDKYTWQTIGSSYLPSELIAAFLFAQLEEAEAITGHRLNIWNFYHDALKNLEDRERIRRPIIPANCEHNAHMYYILLHNVKTRDRVMTHLKKQGISTLPHYVPLHASPAGKKYARIQGNLKHTENLSDRILRLPLFGEMDLSIAEKIVEILEVALKLP